MVWLAGRNEAALRELAQRLPNAKYWVIDLSSGAGLNHLPPDLSSVSLLVHCAGSFVQAPIAGSSAEEWSELFSSNLFGVVEVTRKLLPALRATKGRVIVANSTAVFGPPSGRAAYAASKAALRVFADALHQEELDNGIRVTSVYMGRVNTEMQRAVRAAEGGSFEPERYLSPASIAAAIDWIASAPPDAHVTEVVVKPTWR
jgi:NADP-dependent 3-hydroxy acid dehydrogenase YdfG